MTKITDNASLRKYVVNSSVKNKTSMEKIAIKIAEHLGYSLSTVEGWLLQSKPKPLNARTAAFIQAAIDRGEL